MDYLTKSGTITNLKAAVLTEINKIEVLDIELSELQIGQVLVKNIVSGLCGAQLQELAGLKGNAKFLPHCIGHESFAICENVGPGVTKVKKGDKVVCHWRKGFGIEAPFPTYFLNGKSFSSGKVTTLSEYSIVSENRVTVIGEIDPEFAALLGCGLSTALGVVSNDAKVRFGEEVLVIGAGGGVGLNLVQAAKLAGAFVTGVDRVNKSELVERMGGKFTFDPKGRYDVIIDTTGLALYSNLLTDNGRYVLVGQPKGKIEIEGLSLFSENGKRFISSQGGQTNPDLDFPRYVKLFHENLLTTGSITDRFDLQNINQAVEKLKSGLAGRIMINIYG
jgi:S-(hydroxymethyl)glutathione dehydrogenase/alcohol dehydrogenase